MNRIALVGLMAASALASACSSDGDTGAGKNDVTSGTQKARAFATVASSDEVVVIDAESHDVLEPSPSAAARRSSSRPAITGRRTPPTGATTA